MQLANDRQRLLQAAERPARVAPATAARHGPAARHGGRLDGPAHAPAGRRGGICEQARAQALRSRPDLKAQQEREQSAGLSASADEARTAAVGAGFRRLRRDRRLVRRGAADAHLGVTLRVPIFDGGRRDARRAESASQYRQESARTKDLEEQVELDIRLALDALRSAEEQVKVAKEGLELAGNELAQARRRYDAGVAGGLEVTDAQTRLERARDNQTAALFQHNVARVDLAQAMGNVRSVIQ